MDTVSRFRFQWRDGTTEVGAGRDVAEAFTALGYGSGALCALDRFEGVSSDADAAVDEVE